MERSSRAYRRAPDVVARTLGEEMVLLDLRSGRYFGLNATAAAIWELLSETGSDLAHLVEAMVARFDVDRSAVARDVAELVERFELDGLIVVSDATENAAP